MSTLENDIIDAIDKDLPAQVAGRLKIRLEKIDAMVVKIEAADEQIVLLKQELEAAQIKLDKHHNIDVRTKLLDQREANIDARDETVVRRELCFENEVLKLTAAHAVESKSELLQLVTKVMGHPSVTIKKSVPVAEIPPGTDQYGNQVYGGVSQHPETETTTESKV